MSDYGFELRNDGDVWVAVRHDPDGREVAMEQWPADCDGAELLGLLDAAVERRWGRPPVWELTEFGWAAT